MYEEDELPPYYVNGPNSARVDIVSAISLLSQYCNSLPCDKYTTFAPELFYEQSLQGLRVTIVMPTICPITEPITVSIRGEKLYQLSNVKKRPIYLGTIHEKPKVCQKGCRSQGLYAATSKR